MGNLNEQREKDYEAYVKEITPTTSLWKNMMWAFIIGGLICVLGQFIMNMFVKAGYSKEDAASIEMIILIGISALTTGLGLYPKLAKYGGAGTLVPITGFANSVASPAIEFKKEGHVFGIGCRIFAIAGPVILFGIFTSWVLGFIYWIGGTMSWW